MKIECDFIPVMTLSEFADAHGLVMQVSERDHAVGHPMRFYARFKNCEVMRNDFLVGAFGNGSTAEQAMADYTARIELKRIVINAYSAKRREIDVPRLILDQESTEPDEKGTSCDCS